MGNHSRPSTEAPAPASVATSGPETPPLSAVTIRDSRFEQLPVSQIHGSKSNPRGRVRGFTGPEFDDLVESIRSHGMLAPMVVRVVRSTITKTSSVGKSETSTRDIIPAYEVVAGHRRLAAAQKAKLDHVPCIILQLDDREALELQITENLQRSDLHPLEEASGFRELMDRFGYATGRLAERTKKTERYIHDRVKLLALIPALQKVFLAGEISVGHAVVLCHLQPADQERVLGIGKKGDEIGDGAFMRGGLFQQERTLWSEDDESEALARKPVSVRELELWIAEHVRFRPEIEDPVLFPETIAAVTQAESNPARGARVIPVTFAYHVPPEARDGRTFGPRAFKRADGHKGSKVCEFALQGFVAVGPGRGDSFLVCVAKDKCQTHWGKELRESKKRAAAGGARPAAGPSAAQARDNESRARYQAAESKVVAAFAAMIDNAPASALGPKGKLGALVLQGLARNGRKLKLQGKDAAATVRFAAWLIFSIELSGYWGHQNAAKYGKAFGVDVAALLKPAKPPLASKPKAAPKKKATKKRGRK